uniref:Plus3 domain-containing protein n=1 Tax=Mycena chlorophos TaxID=658473 RepID=A0ABQ0M5G8_MYCCL|nr:predicted protein [Mycena chlorophos]
MSSELDDELLELVDGKERPVSSSSRKRLRDSPGKPASKKRKTADSDAEPESEEDEGPRGSRAGTAQEADDDDKYPLEGKYIDEADREELLGMPEIEREEILAARLDEVERIRDRKYIEKLRQQQIAGVNSSTADDDGDAGGQRRTARTTGKDRSGTKDRSLNALKAKRKARDEKKHNPSSARPRSASPDDMDMSMSEDDGPEEDGRPERDLLDEPMDIDLMKRITLSRNDLVKHSSSPFFEQIIVGCWVRYCIGGAGETLVYRLCQIRKVVPSVKPYEMEGYHGRKVTMNTAFELKHGKAERVWSMDRTSNTLWNNDEYNRLFNTCMNEKVSFPTKREATNQLMNMEKQVTKLVTEEDVNNMITRKRGTGPTTNSVVLERARLTAARKLAVARHDNVEMTEIDEQLRKLNEANGAVTKPREQEEDKFAKVNERNRKANMEAVRKAELEAAERKRRERKAAAAGGKGSPVPKVNDPSARLRTVPRTFENATPNSTRPTTPNPSSQTTSAVAAPAPVASVLGKSLHAVAQAIEVDLGDF